MQIAIGKDAARALQRMPANVSATIQRKIRQLAADQTSLANNIKALKGEPGVFRLRVGDWRVMYSIESETITILNIAPRGSAYD